MRKNSRGFISLGLVAAIVIGIAVLGGAGWYLSQQDSIPEDSSNIPLAGENIAPSQYSATHSGSNVAYPLTLSFAAANDADIAAINKDATGLGDQVAIKTALYVRHDLNDDNQEEILVTGTGSAWCGARGCGLLVYRQVSGEWVKSQTNVMVTGDITILSTKTTGYHDFSVTGNNGPTLLKWNGSEYVFAQ